MSYTVTNFYFCNARQHLHQDDNNVSPCKWLPLYIFFMILVAELSELEEIRVAPVLPISDSAR
jgi:hypothetical protein